MPCGRLLWCRGSRSSKGARRNLGSFNVPVHLGRCWKCAALHGHPKATALVHMRFVFDSKSCLAMGFTDVFEPVTK
jgi:hypothetical protein